jgi:hypothetical protein
LFIWYGLSVEKWKNISPIWLLTGGIAFRLIALPSIPSLSDDYFRFIWDGKLLIHGENPFARLPSEIADQEYRSLGLSEELYTGLNSPNYFTIYPPVNQASFAIASFAGPLRSSLFILKLSILMAEILNLFLLFKLLTRWEKPRWWLGYYALNRLVIIELTGNIHFEAWMIAGLLGALYLLEKGRWLTASVAWGIAIASKLLPIMLFPFLIRKIGWKRSFIVGFLALMPTIVGFSLLPQAMAVFNIFESIGLYFENFEFNAGLYRWIQWLGADGMLWGKVLGLAAAGGILLIAFFRKEKNTASLATDFLLALSLYFFFARIVHPWYICTLVALASLGHYRFPMIWTALLPLTYLTYSSPLYPQPYLLMTLCWLIVLGFAWQEFRKK